MADSPLASLIATGTKLWLDSIDPDLVTEAHAAGATGATSNPVIVAGIIKSGRFDDDIRELAQQGIDNEAIAWTLTDRLVKDAQGVFHDIWKDTAGNDGYVSFELDPLLEDPAADLPHEQRVARYIALGKQWSEGHDNRMIKVPATPAGIDALEELAAAGVTLNVTLIFSMRQYQAARDAVWRGAQRRESRDGFKSVYSIFVSRVDVYAEDAHPEIGDGLDEVGIANARAIWRDNHGFWAEKGLPLSQEMIFASTGTKKPEDPKDKYVAALAGADIQTNPPSTNDAIEAGGGSYERTVDAPMSEAAQKAYAAMDWDKAEKQLLSEGVVKFANPHKALIELIGEVRQAVVGG